MSNKTYLLLIVAVAFIIRLVALYLFPNMYFPDDSAYAIAGQQLFNGGIIKIDNVMPLHPIFYHILNIIISVKVANIFISIITVLAVYYLSQEVFGNELVSRLASLVWAVYPHAIFYSITGLTETLYVFILLMAFFFLYRKQFVIASIFIVLSILHRPTLDLIGPVIVFVFSYYVHSISGRETLKNIAIYTLIYVFMMGPWWMHQHIKYDQFVRLNLGDGLVLYSGNNELNKSGGGVNSDKGVDLDISWLENIDNPIEKNQALKEQAFEYIVDNKIHFLKMSSVKFLRFWRLWPYNSIFERPFYIAMSLLSYGVILILFILYIVGHIRDHFRRVAPILLVITYLTLVHMVLISSIRYRFPIEPFLIIFASFLSASYWRKISNNEKNNKPY
jgi:hypothetical protein